ncbi:MAG: RHS repeat domain-containing protein [Rhodoglobus sp.]
MAGPGRARASIVGLVAASLLFTVVAGVPAAAAGDRDPSALSDQARRTHGLAIAPERESTPAIPSTSAPAPVPATHQAMNSARPPAVEWPAGSSTLVDLQASPLDPPAVVRLGGTPGLASKSAGSGRVRVQVLERAAATEAGVNGVLLTIDAVDPATAAGLVDIDVAVDYSSFAGAYGGDWAERLQLVQMPACAVTTPRRVQCRTQTPIESTNDTATSVVTASISRSALGVMALSAAASGPTGNWGATSLSPSAAWQVSGQTGAFDWSYPMRTPPITSGPAPDIAISYSSDSLDGKVASTNNQTSWVGDGWGLDTGYVERKYVPCTQDTAGGNNAAHPTGDLCWSSENATLVFGGKASDLVKDAATGTWRVKDDDGTRIERLTGGWNDDNDGEYWKVTTTEGNQYYFGRGRRSAADPLELNSAWSVPVFGNHPGEPCYNAAFASSTCTQTWRWNLEYAVDTSANSLTYVYAKETNNYGRNQNQAVSTYVRGGYLTRIDYGQRAGTESSANAPARVDFTVAERCLPTGTITCDPAQLTSATAKSWPDVPFDLICTSTTSCPTQLTPAFFTRKRLTTVTTKVAAGASYQNVDSWVLKHTYPDPGDSTSAALWLNSITHQGLVGSTITLPDVTFHGLQMANRVDTIGDAGPPMNRYRIIAIDSESGAKTSINYTPQDCTTGSVPAAPDTNGRRCFPVRWQPEGTGPQIQEYFHKYLVDSIVENPNDSSSLAVQTSYSYVGDAAWHFDDSPLIPPAQRTWGQFRGYGTVDVLTGAPTAQRSQERTRYFRGMDGDHLANGTKRSVSVDGIADQQRLNGFVREKVSYNGAGGPVVSGELSTAWVSPPTATAADGTTATYLAAATTESRLTASALPGGMRTTRTVTTYDNTYGLPTQVDDQGDISTATDDRCTRTEYARNTAANMVATVKRSETVSVDCATTPTRPTHVIADTRTMYDAGTFGATPTRGLITSTQVLASYTGTTPVYLTQATSVYDAQGRPTAVTDALGRTSTTAYIPATGGQVTGTTVTAPDPDGTGPVTASVTSVTLNPAWGTPTKVTDPNGKVTTGTRDALGRTTAVWLPGRPQATATPNTTFVYTVSTTGPNTVTTKSLTASESYLTSVELFDGLLRPRQTQSPSAARDTPGRIITDTMYDSRGLVTKSNGAWFTSGAASTVTVIPAAAVPSRTRYLYDGAGRTTAEIFDVGEQERTRTSTAYDGDRVSVDPPAGAVPQTTITNARGQVTELRSYTGPAPSGAYQGSTYAYDRAGNRTTVKDAANNTWTSVFDLQGRQTSATDPDSGTTATTYDNAGQVTSTTNGRGQVLAYVRDRLGRPTELHDATTTGALRAKWVYDTLSKGQLTSSTRYAAGASYTTATTGYDDGYRPLGETLTIPAADGALAGTYTTSYTYTADGQRKTTKLPAGGGLGAETVTTYYDALSRPEWTGAGLGWGVYVAGSLYDVYGEPLRYDLGNTYAFFVNYSYENGTRRLLNTRVEREGVTGRDLDLTYTYDPAGNPTSYVDRPTGKPVDAQCFAYDGLRRLASAWTPASGTCSTTPTVAALGGPAPYWTDYTFDLTGNRAADTTHTAAGNTTRTYTHPVAGALRPHAATQVTQTGAAGAATSTYAYDASGNTTTRNRAGQPGQTLAWDAEGELSSVTQASTPTTSYVYTAGGDRLLRRQGGTTTAYLPSGQELTLTVSTGTVKALRYYSFNGQNIAVRTGTGGANVNSLIADPHATAQLSIANTTKAVTQRRMDPHGNPRGSAPVWPGDHGFLDKPTDTAGLTQIGARYYDSSIGRFASVDPVMDLSTPQQWAAYSYASNNPITYSDPTGLRPLGSEDRADNNAPYRPGANRTGSATANPTSTVRPPVTCAAEAPKPANRTQNQGNAISQALSAAGNWMYDHRGIIATVAATAGCFIPAVGQAMCAVFQATALAIRADQVISTQGINGNTAAIIGADAALTIAGAGLLRASSAAKPLTGQLSQSEIAAAAGATSAAARGSVASRASELQAALPAGSQGRVTMGVGVGKDASGSLRTVVGTSEPNGYLRPGVTLNPGEELATGAGHAEAGILDYMSTNGIRAQTVGAGRPICPACASLLDRAGVIPATALKVHQ